MNTSESWATLLAASRLRPFPPIALRLLGLIQQDTISFAQVADLLACDAALSATVLRAANSPSFGVPNEIRSIPLALAILGMERISLLVFAAAVLNAPPLSPCNRLRAWSRHNLAVALVCRHLASPDMVPEYSYMCGLLHSIGQLILSEAFPRRYDTLLVESAASGAKLLELERAAFGADHCELNLSLLKKWNLPEEIVDAAAHHHDPHAQSKSTGLVHIACLVADHLGFCMSPGSCGPVPDLPPLARQTLEDEPLRVEISRKVESLELGQQGWPSSCI